VRVPGNVGYSLKRFAKATNRQPLDFTKNYAIDRTLCGLSNLPLNG
jgi:hypothetical protein